MLRCWHMLEHLRDPRRAYAEILRVSLSSDVRFLMEQFLQRAFQAVDIFRIRNHSRIVKTEPRDSLHKYAHLWTIHSSALGARDYYEVKVEPSFFKSGHKARLFVCFPIPKIVPYEWVVMSQTVDLSIKRNA